MPGEVYCLALQTDGKVLIAGDFWGFDGVTRFRVARLNTNGTLDASFNPVGGSGPIPEFGADSTVWTVAVQTDGKVIIGGEFTRVNGFDRHRIARLNADGSLDLTFNPNDGSNADSNGGVDSTVYAVALQADHKIVLGGDFTQVNGMPRNAIARLDANGNLDPGFNPDMGTNDFGHAVYSLALQSDGKVLVAGSGDGFNTQSGLIRLQGGDAQPSAPVILSQPEPQSVIVGQDAFFQVNITAFPTPTFQWKLNEASLAGETNAALYLTNVQPAQAGPYTVEVRNNIGFITSAPALLAADPLPHIILSPSSQTVNAGTRTTFSVVAIGLQPLSYQWQFNGVNWTGETNSSLIIDPTTTNHNGNYTVVVSNSAGSVTTPPVKLAVRIIVPLAQALDASNLVWTTGGDQPWIGQTAVTYDGISAGQSGAIGSGQQSWLTTTVQGPGVVSFEWKVSSRSFSDYLSLSIGGSQRASISGEANWQSNRFVVNAGSQTLRWAFSRGYSGSSGADAGWLDQVTYVPWTTPQITLAPTNQAVRAGARAVFTVVATGYPALSYRWLFNGTDINGATNSTLVLANFNPVNAGNYQVRAANEAGSQTRLFALTLSPASSGLPDPDFNAGSGPGGDVESIAALRSGQWLIGGSFTGFNGFVRNGLVRLNPDGQVDTLYSPSLLEGSTVSSIIEQTDSRVLVAGMLSLPNGTTYYCARLLANGGQDAGFQVGTGPNGPVNAMALRADGKVMIAGNFTAVGNQPWNRIGRLNNDGTPDLNFNPGQGADGQVRCSAIEPDGTTVISGDFLVPEAKLVNPIINGNRFLVVVPTIPGRTYVLQGKDSLNDLSWTDLASGAGGGADMTLSDPGPTGPQRFYRLRIE